MSAKEQRRKVSRLQRTEAGLRENLADHTKDESKAKAKASKERAKAAQASSPSAQQSATRRAEAADKKVVAAAKKAGTTSDKLARNSRTQTSAQNRLSGAERTEQRQDEREQARREGQRRRRELAHARAVARAAQPPVPVPAPSPSALRVLYLTANPEAVEHETVHPDGTYEREGVWLRTEAEVAQVRRTLRGSRYRDQVELHHRPAATTDDLFDGLNDIRPHAVHFSGHANAAGVLMDNGEAAEPAGVDLSFEVLADILEATDDPPILVVLNACSSLAGAEPLLHVVPIVVAMSDEIDDPAAAVFATKFWAALAGAQSVSAAFKQAVAGMRVALFDENAELPQLRSRANVDPAQVVLVQP